MFVPIVAGRPLNVWLGFVLLFLLIFQIMTGKRWIKVPFVYHRKNGWLMAIVAFIHAFWGIGIWFLGFRIGY